MIAALKRLFLREDAPTLPQRVFVIYAHAAEQEEDLSCPADSFDPPFFPADKIGKFSSEDFENMAKLFRRADEAADHLKRCEQPDMVLCVAYKLDGQQWIPDETATDFFHMNHGIY